ncbi:alpha-ribazole kinase [Caldanaerobius fijiensis DSM 17918]|uniref:Alpha-ribazole kinase n=1 Tax=Caldanaerobius fijiensis DSM 17918 TaxID=1121256 RepID=A0A1M4ZX73_9THEO|nr:AIR synthase related protein [Caldanaerobius fijiensis]SHF22342.1 alpha-ribazole kinase [Caldanaerobius fijiensis DSM 17918]
MIERYRDTLIMYIGNEAIIVTCDSLGSIGNKKYDKLHVDEEIVGRMTVKVALSEALSLGAKPVIISDTISNEMNPTGIKIINGIEKELNENGLTDVILTGSTEENFVTQMTAIGITVISKADRSKLKIKKVRSGMHIALIGYPRVGKEVINYNDILTLKDYINISNTPDIVEAVPVGSKGIKYELSVLAEIYGYRIDMENHGYFDMSKSGGPATCAIIVYDKKNEDNIKKITDKPFTYLGRFLA